MTADRLAGELPTGVILALCDRLLGEVGRRSHRFAWLRAPGAVADAWLPVEAYYPAHRLVVVCHSAPTPYDHLFKELVPQHGLRLLQFSPDELGADPEIAERILRRMIGRLGPAPRPEAQARAGDRPRSPRLPSISLPSFAPTTESSAHAQRPGRRPERGARGVGDASPRPAVRGEAPAPSARRRDAPASTDGRRDVSGSSAGPRGAQRSRPDASRTDVIGTRTTALSAGRMRPGAPSRTDTIAVGVVAGMVLAAICGGELVAGVLPVTIGAGRVLLGLGIAFDACARAIGALDAGRSGNAGWAWACALVGSPAVAAATLSWRRGAIRSEAAPLAGLISGLAMFCILVGLIA